MMDPETSESLSEEINAAISEVYRQRGAFVSRWTCVVDGVYEDGARATAYLAAPSMEFWEVIGMSEAASEHARTQLQLNYINNAYGDEDDDEDGEEAE